MNQQYVFVAENNKNVFLYHSSSCEGYQIIILLISHENICCGYSLGAFGEVLLMSTHNI